MNWQENLPSEDMPPEWMWAVDDELVVWFEEVSRKNEEKYGGGLEGSEMMKNEWGED